MFYPNMQKNNANRYFSRVRVDSRPFGYENITSIACYVIAYYHSATVNFTFSRYKETVPQLTFNQGKKNQQTLQILSAESGHRVNEIDK